MESALQQIFPWFSWGLAVAVLGTLAGGLGTGFYLGISSRRNKELQEVDEQKRKTIKMLAQLVSATDQMTSDVESHSTEMRVVEESIQQLDVEGELEIVQEKLLTKVAEVLECNNRLEDDLTYTRLQMEEQSQEMDAARRESRTDALSGLANRKAFDERLELLLANYRRKNIDFTLVLADIDKFKWINDTHGHTAGDEVVHTLGDFLKKRMGDDDFVARYGGDEFALLLAKTGLDAAADITERLRTEVNQQNFQFGDGSDQVTISFSMGVAEVFEGASAAELIERADQALYRSKRTGRNCVHCYRDDVQPVAVTPTA